MEKQITLFSETDPKGRITFVNEAFCDVAKFTKEELLGKPHSIIRHPDMPKVIFQYCWRLIENGHVFRGILKNKTKEGEHYWVNATIMPIVNNENEIVRYIAVRHLIKDESMATRLFEEQLQSIPRME